MHIFLHIIIMKLNAFKTCDDVWSSTHHALSDDTKVIYETIMEIITQNN